MINGFCSAPKLNKKPLAGFNFVIFAIDGKEKSSLEKKLKEFGGKMAPKVSASVAAAITSSGKFIEYFA